MTKESIDERLLAAQVAIDNSMNISSILTAVTPFGYDLIRFQAARALYEECMALVALQKKEYGDQYEATATVEKAWAAADFAYKDALQIARLAFRDDNQAQAALLLNGRRKRTLGGWIEQTSVFYTNLLSDPDKIAAMSAYTYDAIKLGAENELILAVIAANAVQEEEKGEAHDATKARDAKVDELDQFIADYKLVAQVALSRTSQTLDQLGFGAIA